MRVQSVAVDGPSGAGKSTMAKRLAEALGFVYVDTGAIYRTLGLLVFRQGVAPDDQQAVIALLNGAEIDLRYHADGLQRMYLNGADVSEEIRRPEISKYASYVSAIPEVRSFLLHMQQNLAKTHNVIMDGRDIGTVVLPHADVKIYLTASAQDRARRRHAELASKGNTDSYETVLMDIIERDRKDMTRSAAPLRQAEDAIAVDTSGLSLQESFDTLLETIRRKLGQ